MELCSVLLWTILSWTLQRNPKLYCFCIKQKVLSLLLYLNRQVPELHPVVVQYREFQSLAKRNCKRKFLCSWSLQGCKRSRSVPVDNRIYYVHLKIKCFNRWCTLIFINEKETNWLNKNTRMSCSKWRPARCCPY